MYDDNVAGGFEVRNARIALQEGRYCGNIKVRNGSAKVRHQSGRLGKLLGASTCGTVSGDSVFKRDTLIFARTAAKSTVLGSASAVATQVSSACRMIRPRH